MIAIVDGGATKCDWIVLELSGREILSTETKGFNPNTISAELISVELSKNKSLVDISDKIKHIFFYGAGCGVEESCQIVKNQLQKIFPNAEILVKEDLVAAAYSAFRGKPTMVGILGTGSNSCYFDGKDIKVKLPSLGFLLGDDGSGGAIGKLLVKNFFMKKLPKSLEIEFKKDYPELDIELLIQKMFHENTMLNAYFADFNKFVAKWKSNPFIQDLVSQEFRNYVEYQFLPYPEAKGAEVNFVGSVAYVYKDILEKVITSYGMSFGGVVKRPIENLVKYHVDYVFPSLIKK